MTTVKRFRFYMIGVAWGLTLFFSSCGDDEEPTSIDIPLAFLSSMAPGDYTVRIAITATDIPNQIVSEQNLAIVEGSNQTYDVTVDDVPVGVKRAVKVEVFKAGKRLFEGAGVVNISSGANQLALRLEKVAEFLSSEPVAGAQILGDESLTLNFSAPPGTVTVNGTPARVQGTTAVWIAPGLAAGTTTLNVTWTAAGGGSSTLRLVIIDPPAAIDITPGTANLTALGETAPLSALVKDSKGQTVPGASVSWSSSDPAVASVNAAGLVTAHNNGTTTITATSGGTTATAVITVSQSTATIAITLTSATLTAIGATTQLGAVVRDANNHTIPGASVSWSSSNTSVASVSASGLVTARQNGSTTFTATSGGKSATVVITVAQAAAAIVLTPSAATLTAVGETVQLGATVKDGKDQTVAGASVSWSSGTPAVASVSASGLVTAHNNGNATLTATSGGTTATVVITVAQLTATIVLTPSAVTLTAVGETVQLGATVKDGKNQTVAGASVSWSSGTPAVASVSASGLVTAHNNGNATLTATSGGRSATAVITVAQSTASIALTPASATLTAIGATTQLSTTVRDANNNPITGASVTWRSSNPSVASVSASGRVTARGKGSTTLTATSGGKSATAVITVAQTTATIVLTPRTKTLAALGETVQLTATVRDPNNNPITGASVTWRSSNPSVASVSASGRVTARQNGTTTITATSGGKSATAVITVSQSTATIAITPTSATLTAIGATTQLRAVVRDPNNNPITGASVSWSSSNSSVASVSASGRVTARGKGSTTITATSGGKSGSTTLTVALPPAAIALTPRTKTLRAIGETVQLTATVRDATNDILPGASVSWSSNNSSVASVSASGLVTARQNGSTTLTATSGGKSATAVITVSQSTATVALTPTSATLRSIGATTQLRAVVRDPNNNPITGASITWRSSNTAVASVSASGLVTARQNGTTTITATSGGKSATAVITVAQTTATIAITPTSATLTAIGETVQLRATVKDGKNQTVPGATVSWSSGNPAVASVSSGGLVTARGNGRATLTATSGGRSAFAVITVSQSAASLTITPSSATLAALGETVQLTAIVRDANNNLITGASVSWSSSNTSVASVNSSGRVTARGNGTATLTATSGGRTATAVITVALPDLVVISLSAPSNPLDAGATFTLWAAVHNQGGRRAAATSLRFYRSTDATISPEDTAVGEVSVSQLAAGLTSDASISLTSPWPGTSYYGACVDGVSGESDTSNNCSIGVAVTHLPGSTDGMVLIPAGEFQMGSDDSDAEDDEKPVHTVYVNAFYMDIYAVTNAQYKKFVDANPQWGKGRIPSNYHNGNYLHYWNGNSYPSGKGDHPVVYVSWYGAMAYAQWVGKRLPTGAEWEKAARGGLVGKKYPWGDSIDSNKANYDRNIGDTTPVGNYPPNGYGLYDMAGNVWDFVLDEYDSGFYARSPRDNPIAGGTITSITNNFTSVKTHRVLRGGSWGSLPENVRAAFHGRRTPSGTDNYFGFRCARAQ